MCSVQGAELLTPAQTAAVVCNTLLKSLNSKFAKPLKAVRSLPSANTASWVKVDLKISKRGSVVAHTTQKRLGKQHEFPEIEVNVMDKAIGDREIRMISTEVAKLLARG
jgi:hypothetical protein